MKKGFATSTGLVCLAVSLAFSGLAMAQENANNAGTRAQNNQPMASQNQNGEHATVLIDPAKIYNENPMGWVGKQVVLQNVTVEDTNNSGNFWVGSDNDHRILVVKQNSNDTLKAMSFHKGDVVTIHGTVKAASRYMAHETTASEGSMHDAQKSTGVFLLANQVSVNSSTYK
jgi:hypothetical protein